MWRNNDCVMIVVSFFSAKGDTGKTTFNMSMASWIISGSGASDVNRGIATTAQKGAMLLGKFK